jgi:hypothetical protein
MLRVQERSDASDVMQEQMVCEESVEELVHHQK